MSDPFAKAEAAMMSTLSSNNGNSGGYNNDLNDYSNDNNSNRNNNNNNNDNNNNSNNNNSNNRNNNSSKRRDGPRRRRCPPLPEDEQETNPDPGATSAGAYAFVIPPAITQPALEKHRKRVERFGQSGDAVNIPDALSLFLDQEDPAEGHKPEDNGVLIRNYGDVHTMGHLTLLLGPVSQDTGNTVVCWGMVPRHVGNFSFNMAMGDQHETFLLHFNPRYERNKKFCRMMMGTKRDFIWDQGGDELDHRWTMRYLKPNQPFEWRCTVCPDGFYIFINGHFVWKYDHRVPVSEVNKPLKFHVAGDQDNDNVMIRAVWWGYLNPGDISNLENPTVSNGGDSNEQMEMSMGGDDQTTDEARQKREKRQERFGIQNNDDDDDDDDSGLTEDEIAARQKRRERFGKEGEDGNDEEDDAGMEMESTQKRREVPHDVKRRRNVIHIYGCDHMKHHDLKEYFRGYEIVGVRWLDGSSCNVQLKDEFTAKNALFRRCTQEAQDASRELGLEQFGLNWLEAKTYKKKKNDDYGTKGTKGTMYIRLATIQDVTHKAMDRPLVQSSTLSGQALATGTFGDMSGDAKEGGVDKQALARAGAASWNQLMSTHTQNKKNRRVKKKRTKGGKGKANNRGEEDAAMRDAEMDRYNN